MENKILSTIKELKEIIYSENYNDSIDSLVYHSMLTRLEYIENLVLNGETVKLRETCPFCESKELHQFEMTHSKCKKCKVQWTS